MWPSIVVWFATSRTGRALAAAGALALAVGIALLKAFGAGRAAERAKQDRASLDNLRDRNEIDHEINTLGPGDLDDRGRRWVRKSK